MITKKPDRNAELMRLTKKKLIEYIDVLSQNF